MKKGLTGLLVAAALGLAACQSVPGGGLSSSDISRQHRAALAKIVSPANEADLHFTADGQYQAQPAAGGYYRKVLGQTADGGWVVQDFYQDNQAKQIDAAVIFHPNGLRNFDNDVVDGPVVWYRPDGSLLQSATYQRGVLQGWVDNYDEAGKLRVRSRFKDGEFDGHREFFHANGQLAMRESQVGDDAVPKFEFWYANGKPALVLTDKGQEEGWDETGKPLNAREIAMLAQYLQTRLYQPEE